MDLERRSFEAEAEQHFMFSDYYVLLEIFQYLKFKDLVRAARVCKMWRDLAVHPSLWKMVRVKGRCRIKDWNGFAEALKRCGTQHLDMRAMLVAKMFVSNYHIWKKFVSVIPRVTSLVKLELCQCPAYVVNEVIKNCPQLEVLSAMSISIIYISFLNLESVENLSIMHNSFLNLESVGNLKRCQKLKLRMENSMALEGDLSPLQTLTQLTHLSVMGVSAYALKRIDILGSLTNLETLELGKCSGFSEEFGTRVLPKLHNLKRLRLEDGTNPCCTFEILEGVSKLENLSQLELVNFDVYKGFDKCLAKCKNIKKLLIIPNIEIFNISQSATSNNMVLSGVMELSNNLTHFDWGIMLEQLKATQRFINEQMSEQVTGDLILISKLLSYLRFISDIEEDDSLKGGDKVLLSLPNSPIHILPLHQLHKLLLTALPKTRVEILKIPFHETWQQRISDSTARSNQEID